MARYYEGRNHMLHKGEREWDRDRNRDIETRQEGVQLLVFGKHFGGINRGLIKSHMKYDT